jgi:hypothetical protein
MAPSMTDPRPPGLRGAQRSSATTAPSFNFQKNCFSDAAPRSYSCRVCVAQHTQPLRTLIFSASYIPLDTESHHAPAYYYHFLPGYGRLEKIYPALVLNFARRPPCSPLAAPPRRTLFHFRIVSKSPPLRLGGNARKPLSSLIRKRAGAAFCARSSTVQSALGLSFFSALKAASNRENVSHH